MTQGFKYFMVFLSQSTEKTRGGKKWPVTENVRYELSFLSRALIFKSISNQDVIATNLKETYGILYRNTDLICRYKRDQCMYSCSREGILASKT